MLAAYMCKHNSLPTQAQTVHLIIMDVFAEPSKQPSFADHVHAGAIAPGVGGYHANLAQKVRF
jgi:hypothetical protein